MEKLKMHTPNLTRDNIARIRELFPGCVTEARDSNGKLKLAVDFDQLRQELSESIVEGPQERYELNWPGKREALLAANAPIAKTLRPCREESVDFDTTKNLFIEGDNLDALKLLQEAYLGKIKLIYIDPPYNTGNDFIFSDVFCEETDEFMRRSHQIDDYGNKLTTNTESNGRFHSDWLAMMFSRLKLARNILSEDGIIIISIDENEHSNLVKLCNLVFGEENFCGEIVWKNSSKNDQKFISVQHEYLAFFVKSKRHNSGTWIEKKYGLDQIYAAFDRFKKEHDGDYEKVHLAALDWYKQFPESNPISSNKHYKWMDERGIYFAADISGPNDGQYVYDVPHPKNGIHVKIPSRGWSCPPEKMNELIAKDMVHFGKDHTTVPQLKTYLRDTEFQSLTSIRFVDGRAASKRLASIFGEKIFTNPKDEFLLKDIFKAVGVTGDDIVLDFFAGSGTTMHAVFELNKETGSNCRCILVQLPEDLNKTHATAKGAAKQITQNAIAHLKRKKLPQNIAEIAKERIRIIGKNMKATWDGDTGFRSLSVSTSSMAEEFYTPDAITQKDLRLYVNNIKSDRTPEDLLFQVLLDWGVELSLPITSKVIQNKTIFLVDENALIACFDRGINEKLVKEIAALEPIRVVFRDDGFTSDAVKINVEQIFRQMSPSTDVKSI